MPELPEVETVVRTLEYRIKNQKINSITVNYDRLLGNCDKNEFTQRLSGQTFRTFDRRGKWLIFGLDRDVLCVHLRMEGKFFVLAPHSEPIKHSHCIFELENYQLQYNDTRKFGRFYLYSKGEELTVLSGLGPEPWSEELTPEYLISYCKKKTTDIKSQLLDQSMIVGIGNIYANEICWDCRIDPHRPSKMITVDEWKKIIESTQRILQRAIENKGTTIRSYTSSLGVQGENQFNLNVYGKDVCSRCGHPIVKEQLHGRGTYYCSHCQK